MIPFSGSTVFAGCGKTVLCSTLIQYTLQHNRDNPSVGVCFFYFTFVDGSKRGETGLLKALLLQLAGQVPNGDVLLSNIHKSAAAATPSSRLLLDHLRLMMRNLGRVYIFMDALDENPR